MPSRLVDEIHAQLEAAGASGPYCLQVLTRVATFKREHRTSGGAPWDPVALARDPGFSLSRGGRQITFERIVDRVWYDARHAPGAMLGSEPIERGYVLSTGEATDLVLAYVDRRPIETILRWRSCRGGLREVAEVDGVLSSSLLALLETWVGYALDRRTVASLDAGYLLERLRSVERDAAHVRLGTVRARLEDVVRAADALSVSSNPDFALEMLRVFDSVVDRLPWFGRELLEELRARSRPQP